MTRKPKKSPKPSKLVTESEGLPTRARTKLTPTNPLTDPYKRELQMQAYHKYVVEGKTFVAIGLEMGGIKDSVIGSYVRIEANRRAGEREQQRAAEIDRSCEVYNDVGRHYREKMDRPTARGDEGRYVIQAREAFDKLLGLPSPIRIRDETPPPAEGALVGVSATNVTTLLRMAIAAKPQPG